MAWWQMLIVGLAAGGGIFAAGKWVGAVNSERESFRAFMKEVREKLDKIFERLPPPQTVESGSPLRLTEFGKEISRQLDVKNWAQNEAMFQLERVEGKEPYEVHDFCMAHVGEQFEMELDLQTKIKKGAYDHGTGIR